MTVQRLTVISGRTVIKLMPMLRCTLLVSFCFLLLPCSAQYNWKLEKQKNGISVYTSPMAGSEYKAVKVECTLTGTYARLISLLTNVSHFEDWIFHNKTSKLLKQYTRYDFLYYSETKMPWPVLNRDAIIHLQIKTDSLPKFMTVTGTGEPEALPSIPGLVRVPRYKASWKVTMPTAKTLHILYILELDPGGTLPSGIANSYVDKGPYETFTNLAAELKK